MSRKNGQNDARWLGTTGEKLASPFRHMINNLTFPQRPKLVVVGRRFFTIKATEMNGKDVRRIKLEPFPPHRAEAPSYTGAGDDTSYPTVKFVRRDEGAFEQINVVKKRQKKQWATDMVEGLLKSFPARRWCNRDLNEESGPLFIKLSRKHPDRIAPVTRVATGKYLCKPWPA